MSIRDTSGQDHALTVSPSAAKRRRWLIAGGVAVAVAVAIGGVFSSWRGGGRSVDTARLRIATVQRGDLVRDLSAEGRVISANSPTLYTIAAGTVTLRVVAGDVVKQGQTLAEIDSPELRSRLAQEAATLASLEAEASRAGLDGELIRANARKQLDQATIDQVAAQRDLERNRRAFEGGAVAQIDVARAQDSLKKAELSLAAARKETELQGRGAGLDTRNKHLQADRQRSAVNELQRQVDALTLRAPFDGQVGQLMIAQRASVAANAAVLSLVDLSVFEVEIKVPESFARDLGIGIPAEVTSTSSTFAAAISAVSPEVVNGEVAARLRFADKQPPGLRQNQRLSARIVLDTRRDVLNVERGAFLEQGGGRFAYVMDGNIAVKRPLRTGVSSLGAVEILDGANVGDRIVVSGSDQFGDAERIRISGE
ncbi:MAG: HlyD family efflux transporter periplasmic adaptor subunit [Xanthomonadales bacterium]|nr:HlyD family efflux transporter periplasmic adaptor subunit [Xanthomonadales bacterium]